MFLHKMRHRRVRFIRAGQTVQSGENVAQVKQQFSSIKSVVHCSVSVHFVLA
jgi:hypothetical protein